MANTSATAFDVSTTAVSGDSYNQGNGINDFYLDLSGSLPDLATVSGVDDLVLSVNSALRLWKGEYEYDTTLGISYSYILGNNFVKAGYVYSQIETAVFNCNDYLSSTQLATYGITAISNISYEVDRQTRSANITVDITLVNGSTITVTA